MIEGAPLGALVRLFLRLGASGFGKVDSVRLAVASGVAGWLWSRLG